MASTKRTVAVPRHPDSAFQRWVSLKPGSTPSEIMRSNADRYLAVIRESMPDLSEWEWCCIIDALGADWEADERHASLVAGVVSMEIDERGVDRKWELDGRRLKDTLARLSFAEQMAVGEMTQLFWESKPKGNYAGIIKDIQARMSTPPKTPLTGFEGRLSPKRVGRSGPEDKTN